MTMTFQMLLAAAFAIIFRANLLISAVTVWISNPLTMGPMRYFGYKIDAFVFSGHHTPYATHESLLKEFKHIWKPLILGCLTCGVAAATIGFFGVTLLWRWIVRVKWARR